MSFILCLNLLFRPLRVIADKFNVLQMGMIAGERIFKVLDNPDITPDSDIARTSSEVIHFKGKIEFDDRLRPVDRIEHGFGIGRKKKRQASHRIQRRATFTVLTIEMFDQYQDSS